MLYALGALCIAILIAVLVAQVRLRNAKRDARPPGTAVAGTADTSRSTTFAGPSSKDGFDPDATRIYAQPPTSAPAAASRREPAALPAIDRAHLVCLSGGQKGQRFRITASGTVVGRNSACDIVLADSRVSARHAWIGLVDGKVVLRDLRSTNGTFLNEQVHSSIDEVELRPGDTIFFGSHKADQFRFVAD